MGIASSENVRQLLLRRIVCTVQLQINSLESSISTSLVSVLTILLLIILIIEGIHTMVSLVRDKLFGGTTSS